ncbi:hypothetical protein [Endozoicomonas numazuensis]|nr:hypothetical protein [Endozoicomonas numazuensis]
MFKQLVINTKTDQLGDHDCGVFPPAPRQQDIIQSVLSDYNEGSGYSGITSEFDINWQFLSGGSRYTRLYIVDSAEDLLNLLPIRENTVVLLSPSNEELPLEAESQSGSGIEETTMSDSKLHCLWKGECKPQNLPGTHDLPNEIGQREKLFSISAEDIRKHLTATGSQNGSIAVAETVNGETPTLMLASLGSGVRITIDLGATPEYSAGFVFNGPVQLYNLDLELQLAPSAFAFEVNHYLQLYRSSIVTDDPSRLFTGEGVINISRSWLYEPMFPFSGDTGSCMDGHRSSLKIRACRSQVNIDGMISGPESPLAMNTGYDYYTDYLNWLERLTPQRPLLENTVVLNDRSKIRAGALFIGDVYSRLLNFGCVYVDEGCPEDLCKDPNPDCSEFPFAQQLVQGAEQFRKAVNDTRGSFVPSEVTRTETYQRATLRCGRELSPSVCPASSTLSALTSTQNAATSTQNPQPPTPTTSSTATSSLTSSSSAAVSSGSATLYTPVITVTPSDVSVAPVTSSTPVGPHSSAARPVAYGVSALTVLFVMTRWLQ